MLLIAKKHVTNSGLLALVLLLAGMSIVAMACGTETVEVTRGPGSVKCKLKSR